MQIFSDIIIAATDPCTCMGKNILYDVMILFGSSFILGMYLFIRAMIGRLRPPFISCIHSLLAITGMVLFILYCIYQATPVICLSILLLTNVLNLAMLYHDVNGKLVPRWLALLHGTLGLIAVILLQHFVFKN